MPPSRANRVVLPAGRRHALAGVQGNVMTVRVDGRELVIRADPSGQVLFPTDVGLSLLTVLGSDVGLPLAGARVLDVGCGGGVYTVAALAAGAAQVTALDVNPACVAATTAAVTGNGFAVEQVVPVVADLAEVTATRPWDVVLANPPHYPDHPAYAGSDGQHTALVGGVDGRAVYDLLLTRLDKLLARGGTLVLAHSSLTGISRTENDLRARGYHCRTAVVVELDMPLRGYAAQRHHLLAALYPLRRAGQAQFTGLRFEVHVLLGTRATDSKE